MTTIISDDELYAYAERAKGKVVVLTGGASGIGKEVALAFAQHGSKVVIGDMDASGAEAVVASITKNGGEAASIKCNVVNWDDQVALFELAFERYGAVDIVIPNAGVSETENGVCSGDLTIVNGKPIAPKLSTLDVNLTGVFYTVHLGVHYVKRDRATDSWKAIVLLGSVASWIALPKSPQYAASKHGVLGLMRALDPIVTADNIRIAAIHPWFADTAILGLQLKLLLAATDPDLATSGCPWVLLDDGPVIRVEKEALRTGVYEMFGSRIRRVTSFARTVGDWARLARDLGLIFRPLLIVAVPVVVIAVTVSRTSSR